MGIQKTLACTFACLAMCAGIITLCKTGKWSMDDLLGTFEHAITHFVYAIRDLLTQIRSTDICANEQLQ